MKKLISMILCGALAVSIASCSAAGTGRTSGRTDSGSANKSDADLSEVTVTETENGEGSGEGSEAEAAANETDAAADPAEDFDPELFFETTDRDGNVWNESSLSSNKLTMINFWEPWCGPCVREIPDLERLYENYKDRGFVIIGVYEEKGMENEVSEILNDSKVTYPILHYTGEFDRFQTGYVPTTVFIDSKGHIITMPDGTESVIGSNSYEKWESYINSFL